MNFDVQDAHVGISIEKLLRRGIRVGSSMNSAEYYDCGTFAEYKRFVAAYSDQ